MEDVQAHLIDDVRHVHHHPIIDNLVVVIEPVPIGNPHRDPAPGWRQPQPFGAQMRGVERGPAAGHGITPIAQPHVMARSVFGAIMVADPAGAVRKSLQEQRAVEVAETAPPAHRAEPCRAIPVHIFVPVRAVAIGRIGDLLDVGLLDQTHLHLADDPQ